MFLTNYTAGLKASHLSCSLIVESTCGGYVIDGTDTFGMICQHVLKGLTNGNVVYHPFTLAYAIADCQKSIQRRKKAVEATLDD